MSFLFALGVVFAIPVTCAALEGLALLFMFWVTRPPSSDKKEEEGRS